MHGPHWGAGADALVRVARRGCATVLWVPALAPVMPGLALGGTQEVVVPGSGDGEGRRRGHHGRDRGHGTAAPGECRGCHSTGSLCPELGTPMLGVSKQLGNRGEDLTACAPRCCLSPSVCWDPSSSAHLWAGALGAAGKGLQQGSGLVWTLPTPLWAGQGLVHQLGRALVIVGVGRGPGT